MKRPGDDDVVEEADVERDEDGGVAHAWGERGLSAAPLPTGRSCTRLPQPGGASKHAWRRARGGPAAVSEEGPPLPAPSKAYQTGMAIQGHPGTRGCCRHTGGPRATMAPRHHSQPVRDTRAHIRLPRATLGHRDNPTQGYPGPPAK